MSVGTASRNGASGATRRLFLSRCQGPKGCAEKALREGEFRAKPLKQARPRWRPPRKSDSLRSGKQSRPSVNEGRERARTPESPVVATRQPFCSPSPAARKKVDAGDRIRLPEQIVDGLDGTSQGDLAGEVQCSTKSEHKVQPFLFTRLAVVESELRATKDMLGEMKVNFGELRRDRDEWRWLAERLLADLQRGAWWRLCSRAAAALDSVTASFCHLLADVQNKLVEMKANRGAPRQGRHQWRSRAERTLSD
jgi:hypothetical protein